MAKTDDISNKTLALLVGVAIIVSLIGIFSIRQPALFYSPVTGMIGANNATGIVQANVLRVVSIIVAGSINFGSGYAYENITVATVLTLNSSGDCGNPLNIAAGVSVNRTTFSTGACRDRSFTNPADNATNKFTIENDGNVNVTLLLDINTTRAALGLGSQGDFGILLGNEETDIATTAGGIYRVPCVNETGQKTEDNDTSSFSHQFANNSGYRLVNLSGIGDGRGKATSLYSVAGINTVGGKNLIVLCSKLAPDDTFDQINMTVYLNFSRDLGTGAKNYLLNFTAIDRFTTEG